MSSFEIFAVTNRRLCGGDFLTQLEKVAKARPAAIILREKDLAEQEYSALAADALLLCARYGVRCVLHTFTGTAKTLGCKAIHLPLPLLRQQAGQLGFFETVGVSTHSPEEAVEAQRLGATYVTAGHVFATDCKKDLAPRGLPFLKEVAQAVTIPVYAIGGITPQNAKKAISYGAKGICVMSEFMACAEPEKNIKNYYTI